MANTKSEHDSIHKSQRKLIKKEDFPHAEEEEESESEDSNDNIKRDENGNPILGVGLRDNIYALICNCKKSKCLKLYCDCFAEGKYCNQDCNCNDCFNQEEHEEERKKMIATLLDRNPEAFKPKLEGTTKKEASHSKGCNCKKSNCLKKYCECYQAGILCGSMCRCNNCKNIIEEKVIQKENEAMKKKHRKRV